MTQRDNSVDLGIRQFGDAWRVLCSSAPQASVERGDGIDYVFSRLPISFFNAAVVTARDQSAAALEDRAEAAKAWASDKGVPYLFVLTHEGLASGVDANRALAGAAFAPIMPLTGMLARSIVPATKHPDDLELVVPEDESGLSAILDVNALAYGMDLAAAKPMFARRELWREHVPVIGLVGGRSVCSAIVLMIGGYRYVAFVATDPKCQRRGYAEAAMRHSLTVAAARHGDRPSVLHATDAGRPLYARMGYEPISHHTLFMEQRFVDAH